MARLLMVASHDAVVAASPGGVTESAAGGGGGVPALSTTLRGARGSNTCRSQEPVCVCEVCVRSHRMNEILGDPKPRDTRMDSWWWSNGLEAQFTRQFVHLADHSGCEGTTRRTLLVWRAGPGTSFYTGDIFILVVSCAST